MKVNIAHFPALYYEGGAPTDALVLYWKAEKCASQANYDFITRSSSNGRYYSTFAPRQATATLMVFNNASTSVTFSFLSYSDDGTFSNLKIL